MILSLILRNFAAKNCCRSYLFILVLFGQSTVQQALKFHRRTTSVGTTTTPTPAPGWSSGGWDSGWSSGGWGSLTTTTVKPMEPVSSCPIPETGWYPTYLRDMNDCSVFYECSNGVPYQFSCDTGLFFDIFMQPGPVCTWPEDDLESFYQLCNVQNKYNLELYLKNKDKHVSKNQKV